MSEQLGKLSAPIYVTQPMVPDPELVCGKVRDVIRSGVLTNMGPVHQELEKKLHEKLGGESFFLYNNGTISLMAALFALDLPKGSEVITTPFSFAATTHAISALGLVPVFADIDAVTMNIDPARIEEKITSRTSCILGVHVYGYPCDVVEISRIASLHGIKVVYDAAHAFGLELDGVKIGEHGDASSYSFHATKLFNTVEGGGLVVNTPEAKERAKNYRNFGILNEEKIVSVGINGKMSELNAAIGVLNLDIYEIEVAQRKKVSDTYTSILNDSPFIDVVKFPANIQPSFQYFPVRIRDQYRERVYSELKSYNIFSRRYFYPLISDFDCYADLCCPDCLPVAKLVSEEVLCLPYYGKLSDGTAEQIGGILAGILRSLS